MMRVTTKRTFKITVKLRDTATLDGVTVIAKGSEVERFIAADHFDQALHVGRHAIDGEFGVGFDVLLLERWGSLAAAGGLTVPEKNDINAALIQYRDNVSATNDSRTRINQLVEAVGNA